MSDETLTPMMRQFRRAKERHPDALLFFRLGDFYEMFGEDAVTAARELDITLTSRGRNRDGSPVPMCGVPHHAYEGYLARLIAKGYKVAVCEQMEEPQPGKLVERDVVRVVTPGTITDEAILPPRDNNFLAALVVDPGGSALVCLDVSTGDFLAQDLPGPGDAERLAEAIRQFAPAELVCPAAVTAPLGQPPLLEAISGIPLTTLEDWGFRPAQAAERLKRQFGAHTLDGFGLAGRDRVVSAAGALLHYVQEVNRLELGPLDGLRLLEESEYLHLDAHTVANLELVRGLDGTRAHTLLSVLDGTLTPMGGRLLKAWLLRPLLDQAAIAGRHEALAELVERYSDRQALRETLRPIQDLERLLGKVTAGVARPRDLLALGRSLVTLPQLGARLGGLAAPLWAKLTDQLDPLTDVHDLLAAALPDNPPAGLNEGGLIRDGFSAEVDDLRRLARGGKDTIAALEERERARTGISSLKVGYNRVFGYYLEITRPNLPQVPPEYERRQTLANAERFVTPELKAHEERVLTAEDRLLRLERDLFQTIRGQVAAEARRIAATARVVAAADTLLALAEAAVRHGYTRPQVDDSRELHVTAGRHPVLERLEKGFVPNDCHLDGADRQLILLTGPNMGGKSTWLRQNALIVILAQAGSFVPAEAARIGLVDRVYTRVGASDNLAQGRSTFMVEMVETAQILRTCTPRSLVLLDEVGRGTATFDGLSIAWAVGEYLATEPAHQARTLFATHYHELTRLADLYPGVHNCQVTVRGGPGGIIFLRRVEPGPANRSYGIEVARLAGLPAMVVQRAADILKKLEKKDIDLAGRPRGADRDGVLAELQPRLFE